MFQNHARKYNWTLAEMALLFLLHHPMGIAPVLGTSKIDRLKEACTILHESISDEQWFEIYTICIGQDVA